MNEVAEAPPVGLPSVLAEVMERQNAAFQLDASEVEAEFVTLRLKLLGPLAEPRRVLETELVDRMASWKEAAPEWAALQPAVRMLAATEAELADAQLVAGESKRTWHAELNEARDCSASEAAYSQARTRETILNERREVLLETVAKRRAAAESAWNAIRAQHIRDRAALCDQRIYDARRSLGRNLDALVLRTLNEEMRLLLMLKLGINGLAAICPLRMT